MKVKLIKQNIDSFWKYETKILQSIDVKKLVFVTLISILTVVLCIFVITEIHSKKLTFDKIIYLSFIFPTPQLIAIFVSFISYEMNKTREILVRDVSFKDRGMEIFFSDAKVIELCGPHILNVTFSLGKSFRFVGLSKAERLDIISKIVQTNPKVHYREHFMGKKVIE